MAVSDDHSAFPAHAHLNLLGWVSLFLFGLYYRLHPALERDRRAHIQVWSWLVGTVVMAIGVAMVHTGNDVRRAAGGRRLVHRVRFDAAVRLDGVPGRADRRFGAAGGGTGGVGAPSFSRSWSSRGTCPGVIFCSASGPGNQAARSTSGKA